MIDLQEGVEFLMVERGFDWDQVLDLPTSVRNRLIEATGQRMERGVELEISKIKAIRKILTGK